MTRGRRADQTPGVTENTSPRSVAGQIMRSGQRLAAPVPILRDLTGAAAVDPHDVESIVDDEAFRAHLTT